MLNSEYTPFLFYVTVSEIWLKNDHLLSRRWESPYPLFYYFCYVLLLNMLIHVICKWGLSVCVVLLAGRLYQVEYAMEAIGHAGTCLGILANDGVLLAAERRNIHKLLDEVFFSEKIYKLNEWVVFSYELNHSHDYLNTNTLIITAFQLLRVSQEELKSTFLLFLIWEELH